MGPARTEIASSQATDDVYLKQLATSFDEWFDKRPRIRDAVTFRLEKLTTACQKIIDAPPKQLSDASREKLTSALTNCVTKIAS